MTFTDEQVALRGAVRDLLAAVSTEADVRRVMETPSGHDPVAWRRLATELGVVGLGIPEEYGGSGGGFVEVGILLEEAGRSLLCAPVLSTVVLAASTLLGLGDPSACKRYLPGIAAGETVATLAFTEGPPVAASPVGDGWTLSGTKTFVLDGAAATLLLVTVRNDDGVSLFAVDADASGVARRPLTPLDPTRRQADVTFDATPARLVGDLGQAGPVLDRVLDLAAVAVAAEQAGGAARALEMAVEYAKLRVQFGRPIGAFQAIKHKLADLHIDVECARSAVYHALAVAASGSPDLPVAASLAKACSGDAYARVVGENIQVHGGIGFTWEHPAQLYFKRAQTTQVMFGHAADHRQRLAADALAALD